MISYDMRRPSRPDYADALEVTVRRRSLVERAFAIWWLVFCNWRPTAELTSNDGSAVS